MVDTKINRPFNDFYKTEEIYLDLAFNSGTIAFMVQSSNGESLSISERSNSLRWYLETFIDAQANDFSGRNVVYLLDEPGISLHVNAQRKLMELFEHLADQGNQVVYTTHSPYMLNTETEGVHRIRAVVKNADCYSYIYKTAYDAKIAPESQQDTLTPIIAALGMNLQDTFGPALNKINIVTEGMSDYIYLCTMAKRLGVDLEKYAIIPSVGATNCVNICAILHGWGCKYIALFDFDKKGVESGGEYLHNEMFFELGKQYCYVREVTPDEITQKVYKTDEFEIEDIVQRAEITRFCAETKTSTTLGKPLTAKLLCTAIENGSFELNQQSIDNFRKLFDRVAGYTA
jgi:predicted ATP-dependent endonuclease of OLD family